MKKIITLTLILALLLSGCGNAPSSSKLPNSKTNSSDTAAANNETVTAAAANTAGDSIADETASDDIKQSTDFDPSDIDVDITENMYVTYINEIYINTEDYIGKILRIEGMFQAYKDENTKKTYYYVYRTGPGCCGNDGSMCGFEFSWDGDMPKDNDWIEVVGKLRSYEEDGYTYLTLDAKSVTVMDARGSETVYQ